MKKYKKIITTIIITFLIISTLGISNIYAAAFLITPENYKPGEISNPGKVSTVGNKIIGGIQLIGSIVSVLVLIIMGIKFIVGSAEEKAEYKESFKPYIIGVIMVFSITNFLAIIESFFR